jgi:hypothetical protein
VLTIDPRANVPARDLMQLLEPCGKGLREDKIRAVILDAHIDIARRRVPIVP